MALDMCTHPKVANAVLAQRATARSPPHNCAVLCQAGPGRAVPAVLSRRSSLEINQCRSGEMNYGKDVFKTMLVNCSTPWLPARRSAVGLIKLGSWRLVASVPANCRRNKRPIFNLNTDTRCELLQEGAIVTV